MSSRNAPRRPPVPGLDVLVTGTASDSHTWNLIFLQLLLEERGHRVTNLGPCVLAETLVAACLTNAPRLVVVSSVNGHGFADGLRAAGRVRARADLAEIIMVIGGRLGVDGRTDPARTARLLAAGYDAVFDGGDLDAFDRFLASLPASTDRAAS
jgi:methylaspartate mutase sigma subunit